MNYIKRKLLNFIDGIIIKQVMQKHPDEIEEWTKKNEPFGKALGYPDCCVKEFCQFSPEVIHFISKSLHGRTPEIMKIKYEASCILGVYSGFIPCADHAKQILSGKITLESLIKNRSQDIPPFPQIY